MNKGGKFKILLESINKLYEDITQQEDIGDEGEEEDKHSPT